MIVTERGQDYGGKATRHELKWQLLKAINDPKTQLQDIVNLTKDFKVSYIYTTVFCKHEAQHDALRCNALKLTELRYILLAIRL